MIKKMTKEYEKELTDFLFKYNNLSQYYIGWVPENYEELTKLDKSNFLLCIENNRIIGCIGTYESKEQKIARLLGPIILKEYFKKYVDQLFEEYMKEIPEDMAELRIAFYMENKSCKEWCDSNGFELYNAEKTMVYNGESLLEDKSSSDIFVKPYEEKYKKGLALVHPKGTFFTLDELVSRVSNYNHLLLAMENDEVAGYIYYDMTKDKTQGEIALVHIRQDKRSKGLGSILLKKAINHLISDNVEEIVISVRVDNYGAEALYKRIGFIDRETVYAYKRLI